MTRMWQDVEGTIPATEPGQRVARVDSDGEAMIQREAGKRPVVGSEIDRLRAENEATRSVANKLVGALNLDLPLSDSTEMLLTHVYHRVQEMQYMIRQLAALAAKGE